MEEHVVVGQLFQLRGRGGGQILAAVTEVGAPQARHAVEVAIAIVVPQRQAITADHHPWAFFVEGLLVDERVNVVRGIGGLVIAGTAGRIEFGGHGGSPEKRAGECVRCRAARVKFCHLKIFL